MRVNIIRQFNEFPFLLNLVSIETIHETIKTVFVHVTKHFEVRQDYSTPRRIFNSLLGVWRCGETRSFVFDILLQQEELSHLRNAGYANRTLYLT